MEHILFHLIVEAIQAIDRKLQQPLSQAVPELARLRLDPAEFLRQTPVTFGPRKRRVLATVIGAIIGLAVVIALVYAFSKMPKPKQPDPSRIIGVIVSFVVVAFVARAVALRLLHGGSVTLRPQGAEFVQDDVSLFLPWDIFHTAGALFEADHKSIVLPINPTVPIALSDDEGRVQASVPNELDTPFAQFSEGQLSLKDLYDVRLTEFGALLFELGQRLGVPPSGALQSWAEVPPLAVAEEKGWVRIHLTQLPFPPVCSACSDHTPETMDVSVGAQNRTMTLALPFCQACSSRRRRGKWFAFGLGALIGLVGGIAIPLAFVPARQRQPMLFVIMGTCIALGIGFLALLIASLVVRDRYMPIRWKDYKPDKATVKLKFRRPEQSAGFIEALGVSLKPAPAKVRG
jgi:hypothetical protein